MKTLYDRVVSGEHAGWAIVRDRRPNGLLPWNVYLGGMRAASFFTQQEAIDVTVDAIQWKLMDDSSQETAPGRLYRQVFGAEAPDITRAVVARRRRAPRPCLHPWVAMVRGKQLAERFASQQEALEAVCAALRAPVSRQVDP